MSEPSPQPTAPPQHSRSIRQVITRWYVRSLALILCLFSAALYVTVAVSLQRDVDTGLVLQADAVADTIFSYWRAERTAGGPGNWEGSPLDTFRAEVELGGFPGLVSRWAQKTGQLESALAIQVLDRAGRVVGASSNFQQPQLPDLQKIPEDVLKGRTVYTTLKVPRHRVRLVTHPIMEAGRALYVVRVASIMDSMDRALGRLGVWLVVLIVVTLVVTSSAGWFLASAAMRPVDHMTVQAQQLSAGRLHERLDVPKTGDELERLALTFNDLLARLEDAFKRMRQFSAAASHELRTPLTVMKGELEVSLRKPRDAEEYQRTLRAHLAAIDEMTHVVEELLMLARSEAVEQAIEWRPVELGDLARQIRQGWRSLTDAKAIRLEIESPEPMWVRGEHRLLERLLANLVDNAIRHTPPRGHIAIRMSAHNGMARLSVQDTGSGIPAEALPQIFDRFFKPRTQSDSPSTGLGLGLCRWIVEAHQGRIEITSSSQQGTAVTVWLPRISPPSASL